jgi:hypothetical protein
LIESRESIRENREYGRKGRFDRKQKIGKGREI